MEIPKLGCDEPEADPNERVPADDGRDAIAARIAEIDVLRRQVWLSAPSLMGIGLTIRLTRERDDLSRRLRDMDESRKAMNPSPDTKRSRTQGEP